MPLGTAGRTAPLRWQTLWYPEDPRHFPGFGRPVLSPVCGEVVAVRDGLPDHDAFRGLPSVGYALTQRSRVADGWAAVAGNHVLVRSAQGPVVALCHLQQHSPVVATGQVVTVGQPIAACGNSGNSTEPHLHLQAMDQVDPSHSAPVPITFRGRLPRNGSHVSGRSQG